MNADVSLNGGDGTRCRVSSLLSADDAVLIADSEVCLQRVVNEMEVVCGRKKLKVNRRKVMKVYKSRELGIERNENEGVRLFFVPQSGS